MAGQVNVMLVQMSSVQVSSFQIKSGQVRSRSGQVRTDQVRSGRDSLGKGRSCYFNVTSDHIMPGHVMSRRARSYQGRLRQVI